MVRHDLTKNNGSVHGRADLRSGASLVALSQSAAVLNLLVATITAWSMSSSARGALVLTVTLDEASTSLARFGLPEVFARLRIEGRGGLRPILSAANRFGRRGVAVSVPVGVAVFLVMSRASPIAVAAVAGGLVASSPIVGMPASVARGLLVADGKVRTAASLGLVVPAVSLAGFGVISLAGASSASIFVIFYAAASFTASALSIALSSRRSEDPARSPDTAGLLRSALPVAAAGVADTLNAKGDQLLVGAAVSVSSASGYSLAAQMGSVPIRFSGALAPMLFARTAEQTSMTSPRVVRLTQALAAVVLASGLAAILGCFVLFSWLLPDQYGSMRGTAFLLVVAGTIGGLAGLVLTLTNRFGHFVVAAWAQWTQLAASALVALVLISDLGVTAVAWGQVIGQGFRLALLLVLARRGLRRDLGAKSAKAAQGSR